MLLSLFIHSEQAFIHIHIYNSFFSCYNTYFCGNAINKTVKKFRYPNEILNELCNNNPRPLSHSHSCSTRSVYMHGIMTQPLSIILVLCSNERFKLRSKKKTFIGHDPIAMNCLKDRLLQWKKKLSHSALLWL